MMKNDRNGFSLLEVLIVVVIIGIVAAMSVLGWQRYTLNANLRSAARDIVTDFQNCKVRANSESRAYTIAFDQGANRYTISSPATTLPAVSTVKSPTAHGGGIQITNANYGMSGSSITFATRGTSSAGTVTLTNSRASTAVITTNTTGKAYVTFNMQ
ncbi:MAG: prepilin-type N-terminal cleavage/methylation domain-containing protein [Pseudomonadota bacterium]